METLYLKAIRNGLPFRSFYDGMDQETVTKLVADLGCTDIEFQSKSKFESENVILPDDRDTVDSQTEKTNWINEKSKGTDSAITFLARKLRLE
jgi:hypothetical protein